MEEAGGESQRVDDTAKEVMADWRRWQKEQRELVKQQSEAGDREASNGSGVPDHGDEASRGRRASGNPAQGIDSSGLSAPDSTLDLP